MSVRQSQVRHALNIPAPCRLQDRARAAINLKLAMCSTQLITTAAAQVGRSPWIRSSDGDFAPPPSHTTGRAVFRIRRLNQRRSK